MTSGDHHAWLLGMNHRKRAHGGSHQMFPVELTTKPDKIGHNIGRDDDVVFHQGRHWRLFQFLDNFGRADDRLAQSGVLHVKAFKFSLSLSKKVCRGLVRVNDRGGGFVLNFRLRLLDMRFCFLNRRTRGFFRCWLRIGGFGDVGFCGRFGGWLWLSRGFFR